MEAGKPLQRIRHPERAEDLGLEDLGNRPARHLLDHESTADTSARTNVFRSTDKGATWTQTAVLTDMKRGGLFVHEGALHLIGYTTNNANDDALSVIRRSTDNGITWGVQPSTRDDGLFSNGGAGTPNVPVVHDGRLRLALGGKRARSVPATETNCC